MKPIQKTLSQKAYSPEAYSKEAEPKKASSRAYSNKRYFIRPGQKKFASPNRYMKKKLATLVAKKNYYGKHKQRLQAKWRERYSLAEPRPAVKQSYMIATQQRLYSDRIELIKAYKESNPQVTKEAENHELSYL